MEESAEDTACACSTHISCLYPEILALIFSYLDVRDKGRVARVCTAWRDVSYHKGVWKGVEARIHLRRANPSLFPSMVRRGIRRVQVLSLRRSLRDVIVGVPNLTSLNLSGCYNVTDIGLSHAFFSPHRSLVRLNLALCKQITDSALDRISHMLPELEELELGGCTNISNIGLAMVAAGLTKLRRLDLRSCGLVNDQGIANLCKEGPEGANSSLQYLGLQDCKKLSDEALHHIAKGMPNLVSINLSFCASITDSGLKDLARMSQLREINLRSCDNISDIGLAYLSEGGSRVTSLDVSFCDKIGDQALVHIAQGLYCMRSLSCSACNISDTGLEKICRTLHELETLNIGQCVLVTDRGLQLISERLTNLYSIDLYGCNRITTVGLERIMQLPRLHVLNLGLWHKR